jgi:uncharacterized Tic20 family protein
VEFMVYKTAFLLWWLTRSEDEGDGMKKHGMSILFWSVVVLLIVAFVLTILGSAKNNNAVLITGFVLWFATCVLFFVWLVLLVLARSKKYRKKPESDEP